MACVVAIWVAIQGRAAPLGQDRSKALVQPESIRPGMTELLMRWASRAVLANAIANNSPGRVRIGLESLSVICAASRAGRRP